MKKKKKKKPPLLEKPIDVQIDSSPEWARAVDDVIAASASAYLRTSLTPIRTIDIPYGKIIRAVREVFSAAYQGYETSAPEPHGPNCICRHEALIAAACGAFARDRTEFHRLLDDSTIQLRQYLSNRN